MPRGGARKGAGRKPGSATKKTRELADKFAAEMAGVSPLGYMVGVLQGTHPYDPVKFQAAKDAAPYVHPRLAAVEHKGELVTRNVIEAPPVARDAEDWSKSYSPATRPLQ